MSRRVLALIAGGAGVTTLTAIALGLPARDTIELVAYAGGAALAAGVAGALVLRALRRASVGTQAAVVALTSVGAVAAGSGAAAAAMFLSQHDFNAIAVVLAAAGSVGAATGLALGERVGGASLTLGAAVRRIGNHDSSDEHPARALSSPPGELAALGRELSAMTQRLDETRAREQALDRARRELVAWVSHDLRTPIAGIRAMAEALEDRVVADPETVARYHRTLRIEADRLTALVDDLFELSRIHAGALQLHMERVSLSDLVSDAVSSLDPIARSKGIHIQGHMAHAGHVIASTPEFTRVLRNLLANAIHHTPSDGTIWIEARADEDAAFVSVADSCGGIPDADIARVFDPAFRGEKARTPLEQGVRAGLGLAIARGLMQAHNGEISVQNVGAGCRFTVRLPLEPA